MLKFINFPHSSSNRICFSDGQMFCCLCIYLPISPNLLQYSQFQKNCMEIRTLQRSNTLSSLNKKATIKGKEEKLKTKESTKENKENLPVKHAFSKHPAACYIRGTVPTAAEFTKFTTLLYKGLFYSTNNLKGPSQEYISRKRVTLPEPSDAKQKFLILDLDETLIHSVFNGGKADVRFSKGGDDFRFNLRPFCLEFLATMSAYYTIYVFTAGTQAYAEPIVAWLNQTKKTIHGLLHRRNCMETQNGFFIKDLRIIGNRDLKDIIIVDNLVHSFGLQLRNGIPILEYLEGSTDAEFPALQPLLIEASTCEDVREFLDQRLRLKDVLEHEENDYLAIEETKKG